MHSCAFCRRRSRASLIDFGELVILCEWRKIGRRVVKPLFWGRRHLYYPLGYKPALDGLRALAVLPVLLFHGGAPGFQWGYVGVDLFFVLSGYLITTILFKEYTQTGRISLISFYRRRALRLL